MDYKDRYNRLLDAIKELQKENPSDEGIQNWINDNVPELAESEDERIRKALIELVKCNERSGYSLLNNVSTSSMLAWLEKQGKPIDEEKVLIGARKDIALSIINYLDNNSIGMCLSNMECEDIEDACVNSKWTKLYNYMKKKLEKQGSKVLSNSSNVGKDEQKTAWSEENSARLQRIIDFLWHNRKGDTDTIYQQEQDIDWLKSLKQRIEEI